MSQCKGKITWNQSYKQEGDRCGQHTNHPSGYCVKHRKEFIHWTKSNSKKAIERKINKSLKKIKEIKEIWGIED